MIKLYEKYIEALNNTLNVLQRKAIKYKKFNATAIKLKEDSQEEVHIRMMFLNKCFDYLHLNIDSNKNALNKLISKHYTMNESDWSCIFIKSIIFTMMTDLESKTDILKKVTTELGINTTLTKYDSYVVEEPVAGDLILWECKNEEEKLFYHYGVYLYKNKDGKEVWLDINIDSSGNLFGEQLHIVHGNIANRKEFKAYLNIFKYYIEDSVLKDNEDEFYNKKSVLIGKK